MRVLIPVDHAVGISGPHRNVVGSLNALGARDDVEIVLLTNMIDTNEPYASAPNIDIRLGFAPHDARRLPANLWRIQAAARGCDVVYVPSGLKAFLYAQSVRYGRRLVAGPNVTPLPIGSRHDSPGTLELRYMCDAWFEASRARRDHVRQVSGVEDVTFIHHSIDSKRFSPSHRDTTIWQRLGAPDAKTRVLYVGKDYPLKGVHHIVNAAGRLASQGRDDIAFVLVGKMSGDTKQQVASMPNVTLLGFRSGDELSSVYASADMSIMPSSWEGFGFTVLEAQASGIPVIGSRTGGIPEMIVDGESGLLVDIASAGKHLPNAGAILAEAIIRLADDAELRQRLGAAARKRVLEQFSENRRGADLMTIFRGEPLSDAGGVPT